MEADADGLLPLRLRRSAFLAGFALLLVVTGALLPWWVLSNRTNGTTSTVASVSLVSGAGNVAHANLVWFSAGLIAVCVLVLFVRLAAGSWQHEPKKWNRDLIVCAGLLLAALVVAMFWPLEFPFWGGRSYAFVNGTGDGFDLLGNPGLGWWGTLTAGGLSLGAWRMSR